MNRSAYERGKSDEFDVNRMDRKSQMNTNRNERTSLCLLFLPLSSPCLIFTGPMLNAPTPSPAGWYPSLPFLHVVLEVVLALHLQRI